MMTRWGPCVCVRAPVPLYPAVLEALSTISVFHVNIFGAGTASLSVPAVTTERESRHQTGGGGLASNTFMSCSLCTLETTQPGGRRGTSTDNHERR